MLISDALKEYFEQYGKVTYFKVLYKHDKNENRGYGFLQINSKEGTKQIIEKKKHKIQDTVYICTLYLKSQDSRKEDKEHCHSQPEYKAIMSETMDSDAPTHPDKSTIKERSLTSLQKLDDKKGPRKISNLTVSNDHGKSNCDSHIAKKPALPTNQTSGGPRLKKGKRRIRRDLSDSESESDYVPIEGSESLSDVTFSPSNNSSKSVSDKEAVELGPLGSSDPASGLAFPKSPSTLPSADRPGREEGPSSPGLDEDFLDTSKLEDAQSEDFQSALSMPCPKNIGAEASLSSASRTLKSGDNFSHFSYFLWNGYPIPSCILEHYYKKGLDSKKGSSIDTLARSVYSVERFSAMALQTPPERFGMKLRDWERPFLSNDILQSLGRYGFDFNSETTDLSGCQKESSKLQQTPSTLFFEKEPTESESPLPLSFQRKGSLQFPFIRGLPGPSETSSSTVPDPFPPQKRASRFSEITQLP